jgi:antitoxin component of MazEF toxin-antitoxin module
VARTIEAWYERVIQKTGNGAYTVTVPIDMVRKLRWKQGQRVVFEMKDKTLTIKDAK